MKAKASVQLFISDILKTILIKALIWKSSLQIVPSEVGLKCSAIPPIVATGS